VKDRPTTIDLLVVLLAFHTFVRLYEEPTLHRLFGEA
jgi:hypothetical protein